MDASYLVGGAAIAAVVASWQHIKGFLYKIFSLLVVTVRLDGGPMGEGTIAYCFSKLKRLSWGDRFFSSWYMYVKQDKKRRSVAFEDLTKRSGLFLYGKVPILLGIKSESVNGGDSKEASFSYIRGTLNLEKFLSMSHTYYNEKSQENITQEKSRFRVVRMSGAGSIIGRRHQNSDSGDPPAEVSNSTREDTTTFTLGSRKLIDLVPSDIGIDVIDKGSAFEALAFPKEIIDVYDEICKWKNSEKWYRDRNIPWRRGVLFYGKPGTGKSSLAKALAYDLDVPVYVFDLSTMSNDELVSNWNRMKGFVPCISLIEDIDGVFEGRDNKLKDFGGGLTFDCLLNCLSGIDSNDGVFTIVTTNRVDTLDEAIGVPRTDKHINGTFISTRPGRIDRAIELCILDEECRRKIAVKILDCFPEFVEKIVADGEGDTGAQFQERCTQIALKKYWESKK